VALDVSGGKDKNALLVNEIVQKAMQYHCPHFPACTSLVSDKCRDSKSVIFHEKLLKVFKYNNFL
jgi:hypothetical protein